MGLTHLIPAFLNRPLQLVHAFTPKSATVRGDQVEYLTTEPDLLVTEAILETSICARRIRPLATSFYRSWAIDAPYRGELCYGAAGAQDLRHSHHNE